MVHPLVMQLRFTRSEWQRSLVGLTDADARRRFLPMNCISWNIAHLAWQEQRYWLWRGQDQLPFPEINQQFAYGAPADTPALQDAWDVWHAITQATDAWLDTLTTELLQKQHPYTQNTQNGVADSFTFGSLMQRTIYHYWYHTGENMAIRQMLGHNDLGEFVGNIDEEAPYLPH